ncbi:MAG: carbohydrate-binding protein [Prevotella sp.]|nr:carbohydrate-binding protein [Prevotella sp.]
MKKVLLLILVGIMTVSTQAQRVTDKLTRGLVAIPQGDKTGQDERYGISGSGIFVSWRILPSEYFDTAYNLYRDGVKVAEGLTVSNYQDNSGTKTATYRVVPVIRGVERTDLAAECKPWDHQYWEIPVRSVVNRNGATLSNYTLNDCSVADVDGDGQMEFVVKRRNDSGNIREATNKTDFNLHECYKMDGTRLWWIDMGPNLMAGPDEQYDLILYDWDQDGKAEALMRGADNMIIHTATGKTIKIGNMDYYASRDEYTKEGAEYLLYINGATGEPYGWDGSENWTPAAYPLPRFEAGESNYATVWGSNDTGHRATKHYFGAPYLDGRNPSIFLGRGCYTRHKFCALDVNKETHELTQRWRWNCYDGSSPWFGNGFHNFAIADVDLDGRDEIVFGSMVIDDTGFGLSTTGFGHGDAQHCGDLDPYRWGLEQFVCLESATVPGIAYTDGMTSTLRYTTGSGGDNGRCMAGNFQNTYPGAIGNTFGYDVFSLVADKVITGMNMASDDYMNMRVYWDGDLLDEFMDSPGVERAPCVYKAPGQTEVGTGRSYANNRCWMGQGNLNNSSKNNPCFLGDILGDWREEIVTRTSDKLIIQTTSYPSPWGITSLWYDHEYRNGMTWQSVGYNQPPHVSFFLGEMEGITKEPPALTLEGRTEVTGTIQTTDDHLLISGYEDKTIAVQEGASPYILTVNTPAWVRGSGDQQATASTPKLPEQTIVTYTTTLTGGGFSGATRLVKQGEGVLVLPKVTEKHTGETDIWQGTLVFDGTMETSPVWLNRHTTLVSNGGQFLGGLKADYNATIYPGGKDAVGSLTASTLSLGFGSRIVLDINGADCDRIKADSLAVDSKTDQVWIDFGPRYKTPVLQVNATNMQAGTYEIGTIGKVGGQVSDIIIEGVDENFKTSLQYADGKLLLVVEGMREAGLVTWNGTADNNVWQQAVSDNFLVDGQSTYQAVGDDVVFDDNAAVTDVIIKGAVNAKSVTFNNEAKAYTLSGDSIVGGGVITKNGNGHVTLNNWNHIGSTVVNGGRMIVAMLANSSGQDWGSLGSILSPITLNDGTTLVTNGTIITDQLLNVSGDVTVEVPSGKSVIFNKLIRGVGATVNKTGAGSMEIGTMANTFSKFVIKAGTVTSNYTSSYAETLPKTVEFQGGTLWAANNESTNINNSSNLIVPAGKTGAMYGGFRSTYTGSLTGSGTFTAYTGGVRCYFNGDWSAFEGTIVAGSNNRQNKKAYNPSWVYGNTKGLPKATLKIQDDTYVSNEGKTFTVKRLDGNGTIHGSGQVILLDDEDFTMNTEVGITEARTVTIGSYNNNYAKSATPLVKRGAGKLRMTEGRTNGALTIENGTVAVYKLKPAVLLNGANATTVKGTGRLTGQMMLNSLNVQSGGEVLPCGSAVTETSPGTITVNNAVTVDQGGVVNFLVNATKNSVLTAKSLKFNGTVKVTFTADRELKAGDELTLWTVSDTFSGTPTFDLPAEYTWDTSRISEGILVVTGVTGIKNAYADADGKNVYDLNGRLVRRQATATDTNGLPAGVYIRGGRKIVVMK